MSLRDGRLDAVAVGHLGGVDLDLVATIEHRMMSLTRCHGVAEGHRRTGVFSPSGRLQRDGMGHPQHQNVGTAMDDNRIGDQASNVGKEVKSGIAGAAETVSDRAGKVWTAGVEAGDTIRDAAIKTSEQVSDAATKAYKQGAQAADSISRNTAEQPLLALLIAGAVGYAIAYMMHSR